MPNLPTMTQKSIYILAIESSCDDTSAAVICNGKVLSNVVANQEVHSKYGGVVPELASRAHQQNIVPVVQQAIEKAGIKKGDIITALDNKKISGFSDLTAFINTKRPDEVVNVSILRDGKQKIIPVILTKKELLAVQIL